MSKSSSGSYLGEIEPALIGEESIPLIGEESIRRTLREVSSSAHFRLPVAIEEFLELIICSSIEIDSSCLTSNSRQGKIFYMRNS